VNISLSVHNIEFFNAEFIPLCAVPHDFNPGEVAVNLDFSDLLCDGPQRSCVTCCASRGDALAPFADFARLPEFDSLSFHVLDFYSREHSTFWTGGDKRDSPLFHFVVDRFGLLCDHSSNTSLLARVLAGLSDVGRVLGSDGEVLFRVSDDCDHVSRRRSARLP
jgi:hypothetical protein